MEYKEVLDKLGRIQKDPKSIVRMYVDYSISDDFIKLVSLVEENWDSISEETKDNIRQVFDNTYMLVRKFMYHFIVRSRELGLNPINRIRFVSLGEDVSDDEYDNDYDDDDYDEILDWEYADMEISNMIFTTIWYAISLINCDLFSRCNGIVVDCHYINVQSYDNDDIDNDVSSVKEVLLKLLIQDFDL